jgi:transposase
MRQVQSISSKLSDLFGDGARVNSEGRDPTSLSDTQWELIAPYVEVPRAGQHEMRMILDAIFYVANGCPWERLPAKFPPKGTVYDHFRRMTR